MALSAAARWRCSCAAVSRPSAAASSHRILRRRPLATSSAAGAEPRLPPRLRLHRPSLTAAAAAAEEVGSGALATAGRLLALGLTAAGGLGAGYFIGSAVREGLRPPTADELEAQQLEVAAAGGDADAAHALGIRYTTGSGVPQDVERGVTLYRRAAEAGHVAARCRLGAAYRSGCGVEEDMVEARRHFELAASAGDAEAQYNLAVLIESAPTEQGAKDGATAGPQQQQQVLELYTKSADGGFAPALFNLVRSTTMGGPSSQAARAPKPPTMPWRRGSGGEA